MHAPGSDPPHRTDEADRSGGAGDSGGADGSRNADEAAQNPHELARSAELPLPLVGSELVGPALGSSAIARALDQSNREAAANRAQARELIRAIDGVQRSHEWLGKELSTERRRGRWLLVLLAGAPLAAALGVWFAWERLDAMRADVDARLAGLAATQQRDREEVAGKMHAARLAELGGDVEALRRELGDAREALAAERRHLAERESALSAAHRERESAKDEIALLEHEVTAAKARAGAESARAAKLEDRIQELDEALRRTSALPGEPTAVSSAEAETKPSTPPKPPAEPAEVEKARILLNTLLADSAGAVRYRFERLGGLVDRELRDVLVVGTDAEGSVVREIQAARAEVVAAEGKNVVLRFSEGKLVVGAIEAPFFGGTYGLLLGGDPAKWKSSGLTRR